MPKVSVIISTHNRAEEVLSTLTSLFQSTPSSVEVIVVSAASTDGVDRLVREKFPQVRLITTGDKGWGESNNIGAHVASGAFLVFLGPDMTLARGWLEDLVSIAEKVPRLGEVGNILARAYSQSGPTFTGGSFVSFSGVVHRGIDLRAGCFSPDDPPIMVDAVHYPLIPRKVFYGVGGFDPNFFYVCDEMDLGLRIRHAGYTNLVSPRVTVSTARTPLSPKTIYYWHRNWVRLTIKLSSPLSLPITLAYPLTKVLVLVAYYSLVGRADLARVLVRGLSWNIKHFKETRESTQMSFVLKSQ